MPNKIITNNPGEGYHGVKLRYLGDERKAHLAYNRMHSHVKKIAAQHLMNEKKPNIMVRDFLDSKYGRHIANETDDAYTVKAFKDFKKTYKPELFKEDYSVSESSTKFMSILESKLQGSKSLVGHHLDKKSVGTKTK